MKNALIFKEILTPNSLRKCIKMGLENLYLDTKITYLGCQSIYSRNDLCYHSWAELNSRVKLY